MNTTIFKTRDVNDVLFPVEKVEEERWATDSELSHNVIVYPDAHPKGLKVNSCGEGYNLMDNAIFVVIMNMLSEAGIEFEVDFECRDFSDFTANFVLKSKNGVSLGAMVTDGDMVTPRLSIRKSYNSKSKYAFMFGFYRLICSNGLVIPVEELKHLNFNYVGKHTNKLDESVATLLKKITTFQDFVASHNVFGNMRKLANNTHVADFAERIEEVMNATNLSLSGRGRKSKDGDERKENVEKIISIAKRESAQLDQPMNDWLIYNAINNWLYNDNVKTNEERETIDQKVVAYMLQN